MSEIPLLIQQTMNYLPSLKYKRFPYFLHCLGIGFQDPHSHDEQSIYSIGIEIISCLPNIQ